MKIIIWLTSNYNKQTESTENNLFQNIQSQIYFIQNSKNRLT